LAVVGHQETILVVAATKAIRATETRILPKLDADGRWAVAEQLLERSRRRIV